jgi:murein DD-endopeptidase MepM/ murein hydrolase activator NlpD
MTPGEMAEQLKAQFLQGRGRVTQLPGASSPETAKFYKTHKGYDFGVEKGTPIIAPSDMEILGSGVQGGYGNRLMAYDPKSNQTYAFSHLSQLPTISGKVTAGSILGYTGGVPGEAGAGNTTGAHLDIELTGGRQTASFANRLMGVVQNSNGNNSKYNQQALLQNARAKYGKGVIGLTNDPSKLAEYQKRGYKVQKVTL